MRRQEKKKTNLKSLILILLITLVLLVSSSYAWFTSNQTVTVNQLQVNVQAKNGLQISTDAKNWKSVLTTEDLDQAKVGAVYGANVNQIPTTMEPVSTAGNVTNGKLDMFYGITATDETTGDLTLTATKETDKKGTEGRYIAFDLFLQVNKETPIYLTTKSKVEFTDPDSKGLENAGRVAFLVQGNVAPGTPFGTAQALNNATNDEVYIWEPNNDEHTEAAVAHALSMYETTTTTAGAAPLTYYGINTEITTPIKLQGKRDTVAQFTQVTPKIKTPKVMPKDQTFITLQPGVTKLRVYMWVEGEDVDCENNASGVNIGYTLQFTATKPD